MNWEWKKQSRNGKGFLHVGFGTADAVGTEHPASDIPIGEGLRLIQEQLARYAPDPENPYAFNTSFDPMMPVRPQPRGRK